MANFDKVPFSANVTKRSFVTCSLRKPLDK